MLIKRKGHVRRTITGQHVWVRPSKEKVKLKGFSGEQIRYLHPTFKAIDSGTQKNVRFRTDVHLKPSKQVTREYRKHYGGPRNVRVGGLTYPSRLGKAKIHLNDDTFKRRGYYHPGGVLTHEFAHAAQLNKGRLAQKSWERAAKQNAKKGRQGYDKHEDFAESFRHQLGQPITRRHDKQFQVAVDQSRRTHLYKHYLK